MKITVGSYIAEYLKSVGVGHVFGLSGHSVFDITDAFYGNTIKFVPTQHELCASYMAGAYAKATRNLGVCLGSSGAGVTNLVTGIAEAFKESTPVLALAADVSRDVAGKGASSWHEIPQEEIFRPLTKWSGTLKRADEIVTLLPQAAKIATSGRRGPVYLGIPRDLQSEQVDVPESFPRLGSAPADEVDEALIKGAAEALNAARSPTIIAGGGVHWSQAEDELRKLAELLSIPFGTTPSQKGLISEDHLLSLGALGFGAFPFANSICLESDLILAAGVTFSEGLTLGYGNRVIPQGVKIVQIDIDRAEIGKHYPVHLPLVGDAGRVLGRIADRLKNMGATKKDAARVQRLAREKEGWRKKISELGSYDLPVVNQWQIYRALRDAVNEDTVVVGAGGTGELLHRFIAPSYVYHSGEFRAIGSGLSTAIGLRFAFPSRPVVCVTGDGSLMLELQELSTAARGKLPLVVMVVHNDAYGNMKRDQLRHYGGRVIGTELHLPDLCAIARAFGAEAERIDRPQALAAAVKDALAARKPVLLDIICPIEGI